MKVILIMVLIVLAGCSAISTLPSMQHCSKVEYSRNGQSIVIRAECMAPVGESGL